LFSLHQGLPGLRRAQVNNDTARADRYALAAGIARHVINFNNTVPIDNGLLRTGLDAFLARYATNRTNFAHHGTLVLRAAGNMGPRIIRNKPYNLRRALPDAFTAAGTNGRINTRYLTVHMCDRIKRTDIKAIA
jgi:hypothetical protein